MADAIQFTIGDTVSVFEGTHHVRGRRSTKFIGKVVGFDTETNLWKVNCCPICNPKPDPICKLPLLPIARFVML